MLAEFLGSRVASASRLEKGLLLQKLYQGTQETAPGRHLFVRVTEQLDRLEARLSGGTREDFLHLVGALPGLDSRGRDFFFKKSRFRLLRELGRRRQAGLAGSARRMAS